MTFARWKLRANDLALRYSRAVKPLRSNDVTPLSDVRVLLVEDDDDVRECVADILGAHGAIVMAAASGAEGLEMLERAQPDIVISDLSMPGIDGYELIRRIRARTPAAGGLTPAIALSASENLKPAMMAGYHALITKPFDLSQLLDFVDDFTRTEPARLVAPWTIERVGPTCITVKLCGDVRGADMAHLMSALFHHLGGAPIDVIVDLRQLASFAPSVGSVGERSLWTRRKEIRSLRVVGGSFLARLVSLSACRILGIPYLGEADDHTTL